MKLIIRNRNVSQLLYRLSYASMVTVNPCLERVRLPQIFYSLCFVPPSTNPTDERLTLCEPIVMYLVRPAGLEPTGKLSLHEASEARMSAIPSQPHGCPSRARTWDRGFKDRCLTDLAKRQFGETDRNRTGAVSGPQPDVISTSPRSPWWLGPESNRRRMAFQAIALPTELPNLGSEYGNRTRAVCLEGIRSAIELIPQFISDACRIRTGRMQD